jgi:hypothetical protein
MARVALASVAFVCLAFILLQLKHPAYTAAPKKITIEGYVFDTAGKPIGGVDVGVWVVGKVDSVGGGTTEPKTGKYSFAMKLTGSFDISYTKSKYRLSVRVHGFPVALATAATIEYLIAS